jgi:YVTN family beta-propeller protein
MRIADLTRYVIAAAAASLLVACGGGGDEPPAADNKSSATRERAMALTPSGTIPQDANTRGMWSAVVPWPLIGLHVALLPDGRVLSYGTDQTGKQTGYFVYDVWDPEAGLYAGHQTLPNNTGTDLFCSATLVLPNGFDVLLTGGDNWTGASTTNTGTTNTNLLRLSDKTLRRGSEMNRPRWYGTATTLLDGRSYIQGGTGGTDRPEVREADGSFRLLTSVDTGTLFYYYPRNFIAPDGRIFGFDSSGKMYYVNPSGSGSITMMGQFASAYRGYDSTAAMFRPGRILQFGGNSSGAIVIDIRNGTPSITTTNSLSTQRKGAVATILPNGRVLATGGSSVWNVMDSPSVVSYHAEIWNPDTGAWTVGASGIKPRLYHSSALLLPDATVLVIGGGAPGPLANLNAEIYFPPYLFAAGGTLADRPVIDSAPTVVDIGDAFQVATSGAGTPARVVMVKTGSATHGFNSEQRFVELPFTPSGGGNLSVQAPTNAADAPPGFYLLFVLNSAGVPSVAKTVRVNVAPAFNAGTTPTISNPGDQSGSLGAAVSLQLQASDPNGDRLTYSAIGLPPGISIDSTTGLISGAPTASGTFNVTASVTDGLNAASATFVWTVGSAQVLTVDIPVLPTASPTGNSITYTATYSGGVNVRFKWDFGDGTPETAFSSSPSVEHTYAQPGLYFVTLTATDDSGQVHVQTVPQQIHLPLTAARPTASSNIVATGGANARIWVVNQDNDSVSVFNASTNARVAEIAVGRAPRSVAVAANGMVWVTNKRAASISVIDPSTLTISRTITLDRGTQPHGIAMTPNGSTALVVLEAGGKLLRFDTVSYTQTGSIDIGIDARHVSVAADGVTAYVSRYVTPPLNGESTASPQTTAGGGVLMSVNAGSTPMAMTATTRLAHSPKTDAENQGRGVPNYLGPAVVSPDGASAWVPSKMDNIARGTLRDGQPLNFQNTVRAISSRVVLPGFAEDLASRIDHDNASIASAAAFDQRGLYLFVALETSREIAVISAHGKQQLFRFDVGRAPDGLALSADGKTLYVNNFMDRTIGVYDISPLVDRTEFAVFPQVITSTVGTEKLAAIVLLGKQLFYDARDPRLSRDRYLSCATCHNDGGHDGRVWDLTGFGEGLRNTVSLRGRAGAQGLLHWSNNFDEVQDFEGQIRLLAGGSGLMTTAQFTSGTRSQPLGDKKAGVSADLDALAAYVASLNEFDVSPHRPGAGTLSAAATEGKALFAQMNCGSCHNGAAFTQSANNNPADVGTIKQPGSGMRLDGSLTGIDVPTLRDVWATAPYLHDGSAPTLEAAVRAHNGVTITDADLAKLTAYLREIGSDESFAPMPTGTGLAASYFNNSTLSGTPVLTRVEAVDFGWGGATPSAGVMRDNFSVRWTGHLVAPATGSFRFQTVSDEGVRVWINGVQVINNWTAHNKATNTSGSVAMAAGKVYSVKVEYYERSGNAEMRLRWAVPGTTTFAPIPAGSLYPQ